jgi:electron transfer flavoprotein alpha/beta subunit
VIDDLAPTTPLRVVPEDHPATGVALWVGNAAPVRSIRWLDGACATAAKFGSGTIVIAAGDPTWLDLASDRAMRAGLASAGIPTDLKLDYLGWAQVVAACARHLGARTILVDEASRPERFPEVAAIAELLDIAQLTHVVALAPDGPALHASRVAGRELQTLRVRGPAAIGIRIAGAQIDEYPTPMPSAMMKRFELPVLGLDPVVLGHRALPPRTAPPARKTVERVASYLAVHVRPAKER